MKTITRNEAIQKLGATNGRVFRATFIKRTDGTIRNLTGRLGVSKNITGVGMAYDPADKGLITVFDFQKNAYRMINAEALLEIVVDGTTYKVEG
jgi:hypothetical protein